MNKKILALDLDDTLLSSDKVITKKDEDAINKMLDAGHILTIDSGRPIFGMKPITSKYDFFKRDNVYLLGIQGGLGFNPKKNKVMFVNFLDMEKAVELIKKAKEEELFIFAFDENYMYVFEDNDYVTRYNKSSDCPTKVIENPEDYAKLKLCKIIVASYDHPENLIVFKESNEKAFEESFSSMFSCPYFLEYIKLGTDKGIGLSILADKLGIPMENTLAVGDERNDISMIKAAHIGVCVANGAQEAKVVADYITIDDNNNGAVAEVINKFIL